MKSTYLIIGYGLGLASSLVLHPRDATGTGAIAPGCATGVHMIIARAATESPGPGMIGSVANKIKNSVKGSDIESVDYPATPEPNWVSSEAAGVAAMTKLITAYTAKCPDSKLVLMGYSQGAQVIGDVLGGTSESGAAATTAISTDLTKNLIAVIQMGDPSFIVGQPQDVGTSTKSGKYPRKDLTSLAHYTSIIQSYCDKDDDYCASGKSADVHSSYVKRIGDKAAEYVKKKASS